MLSIVALGWLLLAWWWWSGHRSEPRDVHRRFSKQLQAMPTTTPPRRGARAGSSSRVHRARRQQRATLILVALVFLSAIIGLLAQNKLLGGILVTAALAALGAYRIAARRATELAARRQRATSPRPRSGPPRR